MEGFGRVGGCIWKSGLERNTQAGGRNCLVGVGAGWGHATSTFTRASFTRSSVRTTSASAMTVDGLARSSMRK